VDRCRFACGLLCLLAVVIDGNSIIYTNRGIPINTISID
jgi:hypothetical protein